MTDVVRKTIKQKSSNHSDFYVLTLNKMYTEYVYGSMYTEYTRSLRSTHQPIERERELMHSIVDRLFIVAIHLNINRVIVLVLRTVLSSSTETHLWFLEQTSGRLGSLGIGSLAGIILFYFNNKRICKRD
jgi:hypothetical protein